MRIFNSMLISTLLLVGFSACTKDTGNEGEEGDKDGDFQGVVDLITSHKGVAVPTFGLTDYLANEKPTDSEVSSVHQSLYNTSMYTTTTSNYNRTMTYNISSNLYNLAK